MQFNEYLKICRAHNNLTQEELVHALYSFDIDNFQGLDTTTLSKWERAITQPRLIKKVNIVKYFQTLNNMPFPCYEEKNEDEIEEELCTIGMKNILTESKSKKLILDFPSSSMSLDEFKIYQLKSTELVDKVVKINTYLDKDFNQDLSQLKDEDFKKWALMPANFFLICQYADEVTGLLFTLKLKPNSFDKLCNGKIMEKDLKEKDFAEPNEVGCNYVISFFALNQKAASMLFTRYYAYLISRQKHTKEVGVSTMMDDGEKIIKALNIPFYNSYLLKGNIELKFFKSSLFSFLATQEVIKLLFTKLECEEE